MDPNLLAMVDRIAVDDESPDEKKEAVVDDKYKETELPEFHCIQSSPNFRPILLDPRAKLCREMQRQKLWEVVLQQQQRRKYWRRKPHHPAFSQS